MDLKALSLPNLEQIRLWRNAQLELLRTPYPLTKEQQEQFYREIVCNRQANARYWGVFTKADEPIKLYNGNGLTLEDCRTLEDVYLDKLIGMAGLENIQWENRLGEISLLMAPDKWEHAKEALHLILAEGFLNLNLENIYSEIYVCNPRYKFWADMIIKHNCAFAFLPNRKYWKGIYFSATYLNFTKEDFLSHENPVS